MNAVDPVIIAERAQPGAVELELAIPHDLLYFRGHFPGVPVLPGVVQVHWAMQFARTRLDVPGEFAGIEGLKFQQVVVPGQAVSLLLEYRADRGSLSFCYSSAAGTHSRGRILNR